MTNKYSHGEPNLLNNPVDASFDTTLSPLPETLSVTSTPSLSQISPTIFPLIFPTKLGSRYHEQSSQNIPLRLVWNLFVAPAPLFGQLQQSNRLHNWALNRLQYRHDIHKDIQEYNIQILQQNSLTLKFELTVKLNNIVQHPFRLDPPNITAQSLPTPFKTTKIIYKYDRYKKKDNWIYNLLKPILRIVIHMYIFKIFTFQHLLFSFFPNHIKIPLLAQDLKIY